jgi:hypothetical protein
MISDEKVIIQLAQPTPSVTQLNHNCWNHEEINRQKVGSERCWKTKKVSMIEKNFFSVIAEEEK